MGTGRHYAVLTSSCLVVVLLKVPGEHLDNVDSHAIAHRISWSASMKTHIPQIDISLVHGSHNASIVTAGCLHDRLSIDILKFKSSVRMCQATVWSESPSKLPVSSMRRSAYG